MKGSRWFRLRRLLRRLLSWLGEPGPRRYGEMVRELAAECQAKVAQAEKAVAVLKVVLKEREDRNAHLVAECDGLRAQIERIHNRVVTDREYMELRERVHNLRGV